MKNPVQWSSALARRTEQMKRSSVREFVRLSQQPGMISFAGGLPDPALFPVAELQEASEAVWSRAAASALQYGETEGLAELRDWVAARFSRPGAEIPRDHVLITNGAQQALSLLGQVLVDPGDRVLVENPTYLALLNAWRPLGAQFLGLASDPAGLRTELLPPAESPPVKLAYLIPNFQNPQGTTLSLADREQLLEWANRQGTILIEDNPYGELRYDGTPLRHLFDLGLAQAGTVDANPVVHVGTFSKVLAPGLRLGWVIAATPLLDKLVQAKQAADLHTSTLNQQLVLELIRRGVLERQIARWREAYRERRDTMLAELAEHFPPGSTWTRPAGGMFIMVKLPEPLDPRALLPQAAARGVAYVPGNEFHLDGSGRSTLRLNFTNASTAQIRDGVQRLGDVFRAAG